MEFYSDSKVNGEMTERTGLEQWPSAMATRTKESGEMDPRVEGACIGSQMATCMKDTLKMIKSKAEESTSGRTTPK